MRTFLILAALAFATPAHAQNVSDLHWLKGCWRTEALPASASRTTEVWIAPSGPAMFGYSYTEGEGAVQGWEQMRIEMIDGAPAFIAMPNGGAPVRFDLVGTGVVVNARRPYGGALFENLLHDYPQRVEYSRYGNRLTATISRTDGSDAYAYRYRRISCPSALRP